MSSLTIVAKVCKYQKLICVPLHFIYMFDLAKSLNNRINRNQEHLCFWSKDLKKQPNFSLPISHSFDPSTDSCFKVKLLKVFDNKKEAQKYKCRRRPIDPAVYNEKRLKEKPYPASRSKQNSKNNQKSLKGVKGPKNIHKKTQPRKCSKKTSESVTLDTPPSTPQRNDDHDENDNNNEDDFDFDFNDGTNIPSNTSQHNCNLAAETDANVNGSNTDVIDESPNDDTYPIEDVICLSDLTNVEQHRPIATFDVISGGYTFTQTTTFDRIYHINGKKFQLKKETVDRLLYFNKSPSAMNSSRIDQFFVDLLLVSMFDVSSLKRNEMDADLLSVLKNFYKVRVGRDKQRLQVFDTFVAQKCRELKDLY